MWGTCPNATSIENHQLPVVYILEQNYPNPFNPSTVIEFGLPKAGIVTLEVYNMLGQRVAQLANEFKPAGRHQVIFDASVLSSGMYLYRLQFESEVHTKKMMLIK